MMERAKSASCFSVCRPTPPLPVDWAMHRIGTEKALPFLGRTFLFLVEMAQPTSCFAVCRPTPPLSVAWAMSCSPLHWSGSLHGHARRVRLSHSIYRNKNRPCGLFLFLWWRWRESNSRPKAFPQDFLRAQLMICYFASPIAHQQAIRSAISLFPYATENSRKVFLYNRCQISGLQVNRS